MNSDEVVAKVVVDVGRSYVTLYRCDGDGTVIDVDAFRINWRLDRREAVGEATDIHGVIYDYLNDIWNTTDEDEDGDAARDAKSPGN